MRGSHRHQRAEKAFRKYLARVAMPSLYRYSRRGGSGDAVRSEMETRLNEVVKEWVSIA